MAKMELTWILTRPAKSNGGDRYETVLEGDTSEKPIAFYVPQSFSRVGGKPVSSITMTLERADK